MNFDEEFEKIRPYNDSEVEQAIENIIVNESFKKVSKHLFPNIEFENVAAFLRNIKTIEEFQKKVSYNFLQNIIKTTITKLSSSGIENINLSKGHLYIANHRDIVLDTAMLQAIFFEHNISTSEITVGDNLTANSLFKEIGKLNKMFTLYRGGGKIQMYKNAILHSKYIHQLVRERHESLWIAQRDGRTKDGNDKTQQGLLKMLIGDRRDIVPAIKELNIIPVSTSYEYEPCFKEKINELYISSFKEYVKDENEDMNSVVTGMFAQKGRVHIGLGTPVNKIIENINFNNEQLSNNEIIDIFVTEIDKQIYENYKLFPNNFIAWDMLNNSTRFKEEYSNQQKAEFNKYVNNTVSEIEGDKEKIKNIALSIYANPINNKADKILT
jgi:hypothetical protein